MDLQYQLSNGDWIGVNEYSNADRTDEFVQKAVVDTARQHEVAPISFPAFSHDEVLEQLQAGKELSIGEDWYANIRIKPAPMPKPISTIPRKEGQLWEPCDCGQEPVYMPLHLCDKCWPKR